MRFIDFLSSIGGIILENPNIVFCALLFILCIRYRFLSFFILICLLLHALRRKGDGRIFGAH